MVFNEQWEIFKLQITGFKILRWYIIIIKSEVSLQIYKDPGSGTISTDCLKHGGETYSFLRRHTTALESRYNAKHLERKNHYAHTLKGR